MDEGKLMDTLLAIKEDTGYTRAKVEGLCKVTDNHETRIRFLENSQPLRAKKLEHEIREIEQADQIDRVEHYGTLVKKAVMIAGGIILTVISAATAIWVALQVI